MYLSKISSHLMLSPKFIIISQLTQNVSEVFINRKPNQCWVQLGKWLDPEIILGASIYHRIHFFPRWIFAYQTNFPYSNSHKSWENHHFGPIAIGLEPFHPKYIIIRGYFILSPGPRGLARPPHIFKCRYRIYIYTYIYIRYHNCIPMISQSSQNRLVPRVSLSTSSLRWRPVFCRFLRSSWASGWSWWKAAWQPWETAGERAAKKGTEVVTGFHVPCIHEFLADSIFLFQNRTGIPSLISMNHYPTVSNVAIENPPFLWCSQLSESIRGFSSFPASHLKSYRRVIWPKIQSISTSSWSSSPWSYPWHSVFVWAVFKTLCCFIILVG